MGEKGGKVKTIWQFPAGMVFGAIVAAMILMGPLVQRPKREVLDQLYTCRLELDAARLEAR